MADETQKDPYVNPYQALADKAKANMVADQNAYAARRQGEAQTASYAQAQKQRSGWNDLVAAIMAKRKRVAQPALPAAIAQQIPNLDMGSWGG